MLVLHGVREAHREQFVAEHCAEDELARRTRVGRGLLVRLGVDADVAQEAVEERVGIHGVRVTTKATGLKREALRMFVFTLPSVAALRALRLWLALTTCDSLPPLFTPTLGHRPASGHSSHRGLRAWQTWRPCRISRWLKAVHSACGISSISANSTFTGSVVPRQSEPARRAGRREYRP